MVWPFQLAKPGGYVNDDTPIHTELNTMDANAASGADGSVWTDIAPFTNIQGTVSITNGGKCVVYNHILKKWFTFKNDGSNNPVGVSGTAPLRSGGGALTIPASNGLTPNALGADYNSSDGKMVLAGAPATSSTNRFRSTPDGSTWTARASSKTAGTDAPTFCRYVGGTINKFLAGYSGGILEQGGADGVTWTNIGSLPNANRRDEIAISNAATPRVAIIDNTATALVTSDDLVTFTARTAPAIFDSIFWSNRLQKFIGVTSVGVIYTSSDATTSSWTNIGASGLSVVTQRLFWEYGRGLYAIQLNAAGLVMCSIDDGVTWKQIADLGNIAQGAYYSAALNQLCMATSAGEHLFTQRVGLLP